MSEEERVCVGVKKLEKRNVQWTVILNALWNQHEAPRHWMSAWRPFFRAQWKMSLLVLSVARPSLMSRQSRARGKRTSEITLMSTTRLELLVLIATVDALCVCTEEPSWFFKNEMRRIYDSILLYVCLNTLFLLLSRTNQRSRKLSEITTMSQPLSGTPHVDAHKRVEKERGKGQWTNSTFGISKSIALKLWGCFVYSRLVIHWLLTFYLRSLRISLDILT